MKPDYRNLKKAKAQDLISAFFTILREHKSISIKEAYSKLCSLKAPRFYTSVEYTKRNISRIARNLPLKLSNERYKRMYYDLYRLWQREYIKQHGPYSPNSKHLDLSIITEDFLLQEAPSFYASLDTIQGLIYKTLRKKNETNR